MSVADEKPPIDDTLRKVLDAVPFRFSVDEGAEVVRRTLRDLPRREVHPDVEAQNRTIPGPAGDIPIRVYRHHAVATDAVVVAVDYGIDLTGTSR